MYSQQLSLKLNVGQELDPAPALAVDRVPALRPLFQLIGPPDLELTRGVYLRLSSSIVGLSLLLVEFFRSLP